jgi:hypothetical protein
VHVVHKVYKVTWAILVQLEEMGQQELEAHRVYKVFRVIMV